MAWEIVSSHFETYCENDVKALAKYVTLETVYWFITLFDRLWFVG